MHRAIHSARIAGQGRSLQGLFLGEAQQVTECFEHFRFKLVIFDPDAEAIFNLCEQSGYRHGVEFGNSAEQLCFAVKFGNGIFEVSDGTADCGKSWSTTV